MINLITKIPRLLGSFLYKFKDLFSNIQFDRFTTYIAGLFLQHKRTCIESIASLCPNANYQAMQYFISESNFDIEQINTRRIEILQNYKPTKTTSSGVAIIDDTSCKKWGTKTEGAKPQYSSIDKGTVNCNVSVLSAYCDNSKRYPINLKPYKIEKEFTSKNIKDFKSKIDLACDLVTDLLDKKVCFSDIVFDSWYFSKQLTEHIEFLGLTWITEAKENRNVRYNNQWVRADELVKLIHPVKFSEHSVTTLNSSVKKLFLYSFISKIKGIKNNVKITVVKGSFLDNDAKDVYILVTNHLSLSKESIAEKYACRWGIECIFRDIKDNLGFDQYQTRYLKSISRHWQFTVLAYSFLIRTKLSKCFERTFTHVTNTIGDCLRAFRKLNLISFKKWFYNHKEQLYAFLQLKNPKLA